MFYFGRNKDTYIINKIVIQNYNNKNQGDILRSFKFYFVFSFQKERSEINVTVTLLSHHCWHHSGEIDQFKWRTPSISCLIFLSTFTPIHYLHLCQRRLVLWLVILIFQLFRDLAANSGLSERTIIVALSRSQVGLDKRMFRIMFHLIFVGF